jgi:glycosyltransferase involved in cell wall biosynthesis
MNHIIRLIWKALHSHKNFNLRLYWMGMRLISSPYNSRFSIESKAATEKVAISLSVHNAENWIRETLQSMKNQTFQNWVLFIHDDGSSDKSPAIIQEFIGNDQRFQFFQNLTPKGPYENHNRSRDLANRTGQITYFTIIDHDDIAHPNWLRRSLRIGGNSDASGVRPINTRVDEENRREIYSYPAVNQTLWKISVIKDLGGYNTKIGIPDTEFMMRAEQLCKLKNSFILLSFSENQRMRIHGNNVSGSYSAAMKEELGRINYSNADIHELYCPLCSE